MFINFVWKPSSFKFGLDKEEPSQQDHQGTIKLLSQSDLEPLWRELHLSNKKEVLRKLNLFNGIVHKMKRRGVCISGRPRPTT